MIDAVPTSAILRGQDRNGKASRFCAVGVGCVLRAGGRGTSPVGFPSANNLAPIVDVASDTERSSQCAQLAPLSFFFNRSFELAGGHI